MNDAKFTPFFVPEFGWIFLVLAAGMFMWEVGGRADRWTRAYVRDEAPLGLLRMLRVGFMASLAVIGIGLLLQSTLITDLGLGLGALTLISAGSIARRFRREENGSRPDA